MRVRTGAGREPSIRITSISNNPALTVAIATPGRTAGHPRPLIDEEMERVRMASKATLFDSRFPALVALAEIAALPSEMARVTTQHVDLKTGHVDLSGAPNRLPRRNRLSPWGLEAIEARMNAIAHGSTHLLVMSRDGIEASTATASIVGDIRRALDRASIFDIEVRPSSIRAWSAKRLFDKTGSIDTVARWLGTPSLDAAAATIRWEWR